MKTSFYTTICITLTLLLKTECGLLKDLLSTVNQEIDDIKDFKINVINNIGNKAKNVVNGVGTMFVKNNSKEVVSNKNDSSVKEEEPIEDHTSKTNVSYEEITTETINKNVVTSTIQPEIINQIFNDRDFNKSISSNNSTLSEAETVNNKTNDANNSRENNIPTDLSIGLVFISNSTSTTEQNTVGDTIYFPDEMKKIQNQTILGINPDNIVYTDDLLRRAKRTVTEVFDKNAYNKNSYKKSIMNGDKCVEGKLRSVDQQCKYPGDY